MSANWFIHSFKNIMKVPPMQYVVNLRINAAKGYLEKSNKNISEIANAVGYDNALYFSRLFKKYTGYSPSEYKKLDKSAKTKRGCKKTGQIKKDCKLIRKG